jgi:hypothetical protein
MRVPLGTWKRINEVLAAGNHDVIVFHMINKVFGKLVSYGHGSECNFYKLFRKTLFLSKGSPEASIHGMVPIAVRDGRAIFLSKGYPILHLAYEDVSTALRQHLRYAEYEAKQLTKKGVKFSILRSIVGICRKFVGDFFVRMAWRGGVEAMMFSSIALIMLAQRDFLLFDYQRNAAKRI